MHPRRAQLAIATLAKPIVIEPEWCDCGNPKSPRVECCDRCAYLDGVSTVAFFTRNTRAHVIALLRISPRMSMTDLCTEMYGDANKTARRALHRVLHELMRDGRVRRETRDPDEGARQMCSAWLYSLASRGGAS